jgi:S-adenosylmethionine-diacylglycerol 3-amino-3-carboxypropyl transferase
MQFDASFPQWVHAAARMPIAFAQVREDALLDLAVIERIRRPDRRVIIIASGGCTAAALAASGRVEYLHLVDINPAQLVLTRLKLHLLSAAPRERAEVLGHAALPPKERLARLGDALDAIHAPPDALGPRALVAEMGPDHAGRYELLFAQLRCELRDGAGTWAQLLTSPDSAYRAETVAESTTLGRAFDAAFDRVMALPNLVHLFSAEATRNSAEPFSRHFARRTRQAIAMPLADANPYLWQFLLGRFPSSAAYPWLDAPVPARMPALTESTGSMGAVLAGFRNSFDYVHLSNILDWLAPDDARRILEHAYDALRPGGFTLIRQLNSTLDIPSLGERFEWLANEARALHVRDRSFFYRALHLGRKR